MPIEAPGPVWPVTKPTEIASACARRIEGIATKPENTAPPRRAFRREIICLVIVATSCCTVDGGRTADGAAATIARARKPASRQPSAVRGRNTRLLPHQSPIRKNVLDIRHKSVQNDASQETFRMMKSQIKSVILTLWTQARRLAHLAGEDRAGLIIQPGHDVQNRRCLVQRLLRTGQAADEADQHIAPVLQVGVDNPAPGRTRHVSGIATRGSIAGLFDETQR